jgi:acetyl-CoA carboxylase biotin carboxyl carrier protein
MEVHGMTLKDIYELMDKFEKSSLGEIEVKVGDVSVTLKNPAPAAVVAAPAYAPAAYAPAPAAPAVAGAAPAAAGAAPAVKKEGVELITSPIVGTFYRSAAPDVPPFAEVGSKIEAGATLCILEAMKVMNKLEAEFKMEIVSVLVNNGQMVEYGTPLYEVKRI